jgi:hypothetical protein
MIQLTTPIIIMISLGCISAVALLIFLIRIGLAGAVAELFAEILGNID